MDKMILRLEQTGANPRVGIRGMLDDEDLYFRLLRNFLFAGEICLLREAVEDGRYSDAFCICHKMKGSSVTLSLTPVSSALSHLTELLRPYESGEKKTASNEEQSLIMLALSRAQLLIENYGAIMKLEG